MSETVLQPLGRPGVAQGAAAPHGTVRHGTLDAFLEATEGWTTATAFQTTPWLRHLIELAPAERARLEFVTVNADAVSLALPLAVVTEKGIRVARFADFGLTDYNTPRASHGIEAVDPVLLVEALRHARLGVDVLRFERLLPDAGRGFARHPKARPARLSGNTLTLSGTVEDMLRGRGKKYRKEVERNYRVLESEGAWSFAEARTPDEIDRAYAALEKQQYERHAAEAASYSLARPHVSAFYRRLLGDDTRLARIYTLSVDGEIIAVLLGVVHAGTFTLLRIANGGPRWRHVSPGRMVVVETMKALLASDGIRTYDMGIGDYPFKRGFGCTPIPLVDLVVPLTLRGLPYAVALEAKRRLRESEQVRSLVSRLRRNGNQPAEPAEDAKPSD